MFKFICVVVLIVLICAGVFKIVDNLKTVTNQASQTQKKLIINANSQNSDDQSGK